MVVEINGQTLKLVLGDITQQHVDAIVNAANSQLAGGGGVDGAIHRQAGASIMKETKRLYPNGCPTGAAVATTAGNLSAKYIFHAVGPIWNFGEEMQAAELLASVHRRCLELAAENECDRIAFPAISTGVYGYPIEEAARVALGTVIRHMNAEAKPRHVRFVLFDRDAYEIFANVLRELAGN